MARLRFLLPVLTVACAAPGASAPPAHAVAPAPTTSAAPPEMRDEPPVVPKRDDPDELLASFVLDSRSPARRVLWSWTTTEQAEKLATSKTLLTKGREAAGDGNLFERALEATGDGSPFGGSIGKFLRTTLGKRRYAFANAMGWALSPKGGTYGTVLVRMTLREDAVVLVLGAAPTVGMEPFSALDVEGRPVRGLDLEAHPERIAVVFHQGFDGNADPFREYVVVNEAMLASWELGTDAITTELAKERDALARLVPLAPEESRHEPAEVAFAWNGAPRRPSAAAWHRVLGIGTARHEMTKETVSKVERHLASAARVNEVVVRPERPKGMRLPPPVRVAPPLRRPPPEMTWVGGVGASG